MNHISFPKLHFSFNIDPVAFSIGPKPIYWYALIILTGFLAGLLFVQRTSEKYGVKKETIWDIAMYGLVFGVIGARIYYVLFNLDNFRGDFWSIFRTWEGGLAIYGGLIGAALSTYIYCHIKKLNFLRVFDVCAPGLFIGQAIGRFGNFINAEVYGQETSLPWGMSINGAAPVQPLFLYESLWNVLGLVLLLFFRKKQTSNGQIFFAYLAWYSAGRLFLEGMRQPQYILYLIPNVLGISQVVAFLLVLLSVLAFIFVTKNHKME